MASVTKFSNNVSQTTGGHYVSFTDLNNIKNNTEGSWAVSSVLIQGKAENKNTPSRITGTDFRMSLPTGAEPVKVTVTYRHQKVAGSDWTSKGKEIMNIPAPRISLTGVGTGTDGLSLFNGVGVAPSLEMKTNTKTFNVDGKLSRSQVNSGKFGFMLTYGANTNNYNGYLRISFVYITVEYRLPSYGVSVKKVSGGYNKEPYTVQLSISNKAKTGYNPSLTLSSPVGFSFVSSNGTGTITQNSARSFTWNPKLTSKVGTSSINLVFTPDVTYPSGSSSYSGTFTLSESLNNTTSNHTATITDRPVTEEETAPDEQVIPIEEEVDTNSHFIERGVPVQIPIKLTQEELAYLDENPNALYDLYLNGGGMTQPFYIKSIDGETWYNTYDLYFTPWIERDCVDDDGSVRFLYVKEDENTSKAKCESTVMFDTPTGEDSLPIELQLRILKGYNILRAIDINLLPLRSTLTTPFLSIMELGDEELDRLGTGYTYICETLIKHTTTDDFERDWYKNNRIGVFNNAISANVTVTDTEVDGEIVETITDTTDYDNLTVEDIFDNAEYWSQPLTEVNTYESLECEFTYNEDYPLYLIITGDYPEAYSTYGYDMGTLTYTEPSIIEKTVYQGRETNGNYPVPIENLITENGSGECQVGTLNHSTPVILYDYPLTSGYGTNENLCVRGIEVTGTIEQSDEVVLSAKLVSPTGQIGERTTIINNEDTTIDSDTSFKLGGLGDLWGFKTTDITDLEDWELQLTVNNILLEDVANINYGDITLAVYIEQLEEQLINVSVDGEDLSYYGAFIEEVKIPEGLETDTSFLTIDGTDTNDAYRQNIREKEIEITLTIGECDLQTSTDMLRQLTKLLVNDKDSYNRPIPKRIEFSHYPDVYFEYIMKDALDITTETSYYEVKAKLTIPAGTAYTKETTSTNITGNVQGLAAISPLISFKPQGTVIEINETVSSQRFSMGYSGDWQTKIVVLDCANRIAYLQSNEDDTNPVDISKYVDFNSDWFSLHGEYSFSATNCVIRRVEYQERW